TSCARVRCRWSAQPWPSSRNTALRGDFIPTEPSSAAVTVRLSIQSHGAPQSLAIQAAPPLMLLRVSRALAHDGDGLSYFLGMDHYGGKANSGPKPRYRHSGYR